MSFEQIKLIAIISVIANIVAIFVVRHTILKTAKLLIGGLYGIEITSGNPFPDMSKPNFNKYMKFCNDMHERYKDERPDV